MASRVLVIAAIAAALTGGCGSSAPSHSANVPGNADPAAVAVIKGWVDSLRRGEVAKAASYFAIPSVVQNGGPPLRIGDRRGAIVFNESLPCGARLVRAVRHGLYTIATFRLTERPGPGTCGTGTGQMARTAFSVRDDRIVQWRRVPTGAGAQPGNTV
jgi:hypothetical protein